MIRSFEPDLSYDRERLLRREHIRPGSPAYARFTDLLPAAEKQLAEKVHAECRYTFPEKPFFVGAASADNAERQILCGVTLGAEASAAAGDAMEHGDYMEGYVLNALTDELLFSVSEALSRAVAAQMKEAGFGLSPGLFPGSEIPLSLQKEFLDYFHREDVFTGVSLTGGLMLCPEKSMLYLFGADRSYPFTDGVHDCSQCEHSETCLFRV